MFHVGFLGTYPRTPNWEYVHHGTSKVKRPQLSQALKRTSPSHHQRSRPSSRSRSVQSGQATDDQRWTLPIEETIRVSRRRQVYDINQFVTNPPGPHATQVARRDSTASTRLLMIDACVATTLAFSFGIHIFIKRPALKIRNLTLKNHATLPRTVREFVPAFLIPFSLVLSLALFRSEAFASELGLHLFVIGMGVSLASNLCGAAIRLECQARAGQARR